MMTGLCFPSLWTGENILGLIIQCSDLVSTLFVIDRLWMGGALSAPLTVSRPLDPPTPVVVQYAGDWFDIVKIYFDCNGLIEETVVDYELILILSIYREQSIKQYRIVRRNTYADVHEPGSV